MNHSDKSTKNRPHKAQELVIPSGQQEVMRLYDGQLVEQDRLLYPQSPQDAASAEKILLKDLAKSKQGGKHIALMTGAYDVPHDNHTWFAREARLRAARSHFGEDFATATQSKQQAMVASNEILLILTLNADAKVAARKSFRPEKGNVARPVYPWNTRADRMGGLTIPNGKGGYRPVIDLLVVDGDPAHQGSIFESHLELARNLVHYDLLDTWIIFDEHESTIQTARTYVGEKSSIISIVPQNEARFAIDSSTGSYWSSSKIISRIIGSHS